MKWTSTDVVCIGYIGESSAPIIIWIGVLPTSLSGDYGVVVVSKCLELLRENDIADVEVEIRESVVTRSAGPKFLTPTFSSNPTAEVPETLTTTVGLPICGESTPWIEGTAGLFIAEGGKPERLLLLTAHHVVFTPDNEKNEHFERRTDSQRRHDVVLFGDAAFKKYLESIQVEIKGKGVMAEYHARRVKAVEGRDDPEVNEERENAQTAFVKAEKAMELLSTFYEDVLTHWATRESRVFGHVILSPPINVGVGSGGYTEDWAVIEIDSSKVDANNFKGNSIDLGTRIPPYEFTRMMFRGTIPDEEMRRSTTLDQNGDPCLMVIKRGNTTGLTVGRANNIYSYIRDDYGDGNAETSKEWAILPFDSKSGPFSAKGDSGSIIVDGLGRVGGLLTGGAGVTLSSDVTYATPIRFLLGRMQSRLNRPHINPVLGPSGKRLSTT
ncbi:hypothetical protein BJV78DRAFT_1347568 [Lactifluus subvellereus]|nr:hypothetical protein BJV78DRAFT_1347568 [Lactifluus subvellereus]